MRRDGLACQYLQVGLSWWMKRAYPVSIGRACNLGTLRASLRHLMFRRKMSPPTQIVKHKHEDWTRLRRRQFVSQTAGDEATLRCPIVTFGQRPRAPALVRYASHTVGIE